MEIAPAHNSARPPVTTSLEDPNEDRPAVKAKGTVKPSDNPMILLNQLLLSIPWLQHLHIPDDLGADQVPLIVALEILAALVTFSSVRRALVGKRLGISENAIEDLFLSWLLLRLHSPHLLRGVLLGVAILRLGESDRLATVGVGIVALAAGTRAGTVGARAGHGRQAESVMNAMGESDA